MSKQQIFGFLISIVGLFSAGASGQVGGAKDPTNARLPYVIAFSDLERDDKKMRSISVLIKPESFRKESLIKLTKLIGNRFIKPDTIYFNFYTELEDIPTPEEKDGPAMSTPKQVRAKNKNRGDYAIFVRLSKNNYGNCFMYFANGDFQEVKIDP